MRQPRLPLGRLPGASTYTKMVVRVSDGKTVIRHHLFPGEYVDTEVPKGLVEKAKKIEEAQKEKPPQN